MGTEDVQLPDDDARQGIREVTKGNPIAYALSVVAVILGVVGILRLMSYVKTTYPSFYKTAGDLYAEFPIAGPLLFVAGCFLLVGVLTIVEKISGYCSSLIDDIANFIRPRT